MSKAKAKRAAQPSDGGFLLPGHQQCWWPAKPKMQGSAMKILDPENLPFPPNQDAMDYVMRAIASVLAWKHPAIRATRNSIENLKIVYEAMTYGVRITDAVICELESRLAGNSDELQRFRERYEGE
jgi:hypothetical protein